MTDKGVFEKLKAKKPKKEKSSTSRPLHDVFSTAVAAIYPFHSYRSSRLGGGDGRGELGRGIRLVVGRISGNYEGGC